MKYFLFSETKAQGAIEYLLIIGAALIVVAVVIIAITGIITSSDTASSGEDYNNQLTGLKDLI